MPAALEREPKLSGWNRDRRHGNRPIEGSPALRRAHRSHLDTVRNGGRYDGTYGVVAALEALRSFHDEGYKPERAIEFIAFAEEEGSNFGSTCLGSKGIAGQIDVEGLKRLSNAEGSAYDALRAFGLDPDALPGEQIDPANVKAFLEVHIEQNAMLEDAGRELGIVTAISGMRLHRIVYKAIRITPPAHAGRAIPAGSPSWPSAWSSFGRTRLPEFSAPSANWPVPNVGIVV
ncbi:MAG: M20/M25/M40 family metallo-hydrolase [Bilophila wadsworthia]